MFLTNIPLEACWCNLILSPHPLGRYIFDEARDQPQPGSFPKKDPGYEVEPSTVYLCLDCPCIPRQSWARHV